MPTPFWNAEVIDDLECHVLVAAYAEPLWLRIYPKSGPLSVAHRVDAYGLQWPCEESRQCAQKENAVHRGTAFLLTFDEPYPDGSIRMSD